MEPVGSTSAQLAQPMEVESVRWAQVVKNRKLKAN
jgi:hypothetical protein